MMKSIHFLRPALLAFGLLLAGTVLAAEPHAFSATYKVLRGGSAVGESTLTLRADGDNQWTYTSSMRGTSGLAALLGASVDETSRFRWRDGHAEALSYDYRMSAAVKHKQRHVTVDWITGKVRVDSSEDGQFTYAATPGLVERHLLPLALGHAVAAGQTRISLPVAVKDRVQEQTFAVVGKDTIEVPAGRFETLRVKRTDDHKGYVAWYAPDRFKVPVKLSQEAGGDITLLLESYK